MLRKVLPLLFVLPAAQAESQKLDALFAEARDPVIAFRRDFHQNPELGNRETRTAGIVAAELKR